jgi:hypothetical protein
LGLRLCEAIRRVRANSLPREALTQQQLAQIIQIKSMLLDRDKRMVLLTVTPSLITTDCLDRNLKARCNSMD